MCVYLTCIVTSKPNFVFCVQSFLPVRTLNEGFESSSEAGINLKTFENTDNSFNAATALEGDD